MFFIHKRARYACRSSPASLSHSAQKMDTSSRVSRPLPRVSASLPLLTPCVAVSWSVLAASGLGARLNPLLGLPELKSLHDALIGKTASSILFYHR